MSGLGTVGSSTELPPKGVIVISWTTSERRSELPPDWETNYRQPVLKRAGYKCEIAGCSRRATDVDHKRRGNDHSHANLQALCGDHHGKKSAREGVAQRRKLQAQRKRPPERHPGMR